MSDDDDDSFIGNLIKNNPIRREDLVDKYRYQTPNKNKDRKRPPKDDD